jgi:hypothetical protein
MRVISKQGEFKTTNSITTFEGDVTVREGDTYKTISGTHYHHNYQWGAHWNINGGRIWK